MVRIPLHGRRVRGWVVADGIRPRAGVEVRPLGKVTGMGPPPGLVDLARWAAWRWAGPVSSFLAAASPRRRVVALHPSPPSRGHGLPNRYAMSSEASGDGLVEEAFSGGRVVVRLPPADDPLPYALAAASRGSALVLTPSAAGAALLHQRLQRAGHPVSLAPRDWPRAAAGGCTVVGARAGAWTPVPDLAAVLVLDVHDEAYQEQRAPTWSGWRVAAERACRAGVPCVLTSPCPPLDVLAGGRLLVPPRARERGGWPALEVVDRRRDDPRSGLYSDRLVALVRSGRRVACVLNRKGRARLLACHACGEVTRCERCGSAVEPVEDGLRCRSCGTERPRLCLSCGAQQLKLLRPGVARVREELGALAGRPVDEVTTETVELPRAEVVVGTEAVLHRLPGADAVAFLDFDQELLAPRFRAAEQALALLARAARLVGGRSRGRILVQTRLPAHEVLDAALHADPGRLAAAEAPRRAALRLPPATAVAVVSGPKAGGFVAALPSTVEASGPQGDRWLVRAHDHTALCDALAAPARPAGGLRIEVDPTRV